MTTLEFIIPGIPVPKARARTVVRAGRTMTFTPSKTRDYERGVAVLAQAAGARPVRCPVRVTLAVYLPDARRRDLDNLAKSILDGLNGVAYADDSQIVELHAEKAIDRGHPRAWVRIEALNERSE